MKAYQLRSLALLILPVLLGAKSEPAAAQQEEGVALAIVYDTSGSMRELVRDGTGKMAPKYQIARRALESILQRLRAFATNASGGGPRKIEAGLFAFSNRSAKEVVKFGPLELNSLQNWTRDLPQPNSGTPLGNALSRAGHAVLNSKLSHKHVLVITDGMNTVGPDPSVTMPRLKKIATETQANFSVHFVAFNVDAKVFDSVKALGATVVGAADEKQLNTQLEFILQRKILLEEEEAPVKKK